MFTVKELKAIRMVAGIIAGCMFFLLWSLAEMVGAGTISILLTLVLLAVALLALCFCGYLLEQSAYILKTKYNIDVEADDEEMYDDDEYFNE